MEVGGGKGFQVAARVALFPFCQWKPKFRPQSAALSEAALPSQAARWMGVSGMLLQGGAAQLRCWESCFPPRCPAGSPPPAMPPRARRCWSFPPP